MHLIIELIIIVLVLLILTKMEKFEEERVMLSYKLNEIDGRFLNKVMEIEESTLSYSKLGEEMSLISSKLFEANQQIQGLKDQLMKMVQGAKGLLDAQEVLKGLSDRITFGEAEILQNTLLVYASMIPQDKRNEAFHRHVNGVCEVLQNHASERIRLELSKLLPDSEGLKMKKREKMKQPH